jgi:hypothetical protein
MRLDHVSYATSHDQISDVVNRIGSQIGTAFVDGGIHPKFGTRNFTAPLLNGQYIEIVCPLDHPATDATPFGKAVKKKVDAGGGWLTWVLATTEIEIIENHIGRKSVTGLRIKPNGSKLEWKQLGVLSNIDDGQQPFFIEWITDNHPANDGIPVAEINKILISGKKERITNLPNNPNFEIPTLVEFVTTDKGSIDTQNGISAVLFHLNNTIVKIY